MPRDFRDFPEFYANPLIRSIAGIEKWSVSDKDKRPIDMFDLKTFGHIHGATWTDGRSLMTLDALVDFLPDAANHAFYLDAMTDSFVVLDVEKTCPDDIKQKLLQLPYVYGETSLSGQGLHLLFPLPSCIKDYPIAMQKPAMREEHGYYEILLNHWVTFTRNMLPPATGNGNFEELFRELASKQTESKRVDFDVETQFPQGIYEAAKICYHLKRQTPYSKTPEDFFGDRSKYEYGHTSYLYHRLRKLIAAVAPDHHYTPNELAWMLYKASSRTIPYREKHDEERDGLPWLLYLAREVIAKHALEEDDNAQ